jgi:hypothetical protein
MLPPTCVVVPTYWTRAGSQSLPGDAVYDHPTPLDGSSTLPALLESLAKLETPFYLLVLVAVTGPDVAAAAERRVRELLSEHLTVASLLFGPTELARFHAWLRQNDLDYATSFLDLQTYAKVRNLQLAVPLILGSQAIVAVDDDEIVTDPLFVEKGVEFLGTYLDGHRIDGLSGHYLQEDGTILLKVDPAKASSANIFDRKAAIMNAATETLEARPGNIVATPFCFGGNMEFTPELAASVGFDPGITRGEDIDYLIDARLEGKRFFLRKDLQILHCPPKGGSYRDVSRSKLEQDVVRFLYEREKLRLSQQRSDLETLTAQSLMPYPGEFLEGSIEEAAVEALQAAGHPGDARQFVQQVLESLPARIERYLEFRQQWPAAMEALAGNEEMNEALTSKVQAPTRTAAKTKVQP